MPLVLLCLINVIGGAAAYIIGGFWALTVVLAIVAGGALILTP